MAHKAEHYLSLADETVVDQLVKAHHSRPNLVTESDLGMAMIRFNTSEAVNKLLCEVNGVNWDESSELSK